MHHIDQLLHNVCIVDITIKKTKQNNPTRPLEHDGGSPPNAGATGGGQFTVLNDQIIIVEDTDLDGLEDNYDRVVQHVRNEHPVMLQVGGSALIRV